MLLERQKLINFLPNMQYQIITNCDNRTVQRYRSWNMGRLYL